LQQHTAETTEWREHNRLGDLERMELEPSLGSCSREDQSQWVARYTHKTGERETKNMDNVGEKSQQSVNKE
jgi:hypothetical protein